VNARRWPLALLSISLLPILALGGCSSSTEPEHKVGIPALGDDYVVFSWNDLGMHCLNPTYDQAVILPPYNTVWAQVVRRGNPPVVVTEGLTVEYRMVDNTWSYGKADPHGGAFSQFWDNAPALFGASLAQDTGLNLEDPGIHNGLSGTMVAKGDHFQVNGIPVVPVNDAGLWSPYQVIEVTVRSAGVMVARTRATVPTSDEIDCAKCHGDRPFEDILAKHDAMHGTALAAAAPVLCANGTCHGSPALGQSGPGSGGYLSAAIHGAHADRNAACLDCHPGATTACNRSLAHTAPDGDCTACHGTLDDVASSIDGGRVPWASEPRCVTCHPGVAEVDTQDTLYRNAAGHGGMGCPACHGSPHAMIPSREGSDQYQSRQYQNSDRTIGSCGVCHGSSRGEGSAEFAETHGGSGGEPTACRVCHTAVSAQTASWPHRFQWKSR
jgi:hypothetical protein